MSIDGSPFRYLAEVCAASKFDVRAVHLTYQSLSKKNCKPLPFLAQNNPFARMYMVLLFAI